MSDAERSPVMPDLSVVVPMRDERDNVRPLLRRLRHTLDAAGLDWEAVVVDDGSRDGTAAALLAEAAADARVRVVRLWRPFGQSAALQAGFDRARGRVVVTMDGDLQNDPADIPRLLAALDDGFDVVLGRRERRQDSWLTRRLPSEVGNWVLRRATGVPFRDFGCTLRAMRREVVAGLSLYGERHRFLTPLLVWGGARAVQVAVRHHPRTAGRSKYGLSRSVRVLLDLLAVLFLHRFAARPLHAFGPVGLLLLAGGVLGLMLGAAGGLLVLCGVQLVGLGLLGELLVAGRFAGRKRPYRVRVARSRRVGTRLLGGPAG